MSRAVLALDSDSTPASKSKGSGLRVSKPGDTLEREADRVAETVTSGARVPTWSLATAGSGGLQRQSVPPEQPAGQQPAPKPDNYGDALSKIAEAFLKTKTGQEMVSHFTDDDPLAKSATEFVKTPGGIAVTGAAAAGAIAALAATHKPLPAQLPAIPLDKLSSRLAGFKLKFTYEGPVDRPTSGMLTLSYEGKSSDKKKKLSDTERTRAETARIAAEQEKFRAGLQPSQPGPVAEQQKKESQLIQNWALRRGTITGGILGSGSVWDPAQTGKKYPQFDLHMREPEISTGTSTGASAKAPAAQPGLPEAKKKEEIPVQRKALSNAEAFGDFAEPDAAQIDSVLRSSGRPLDHETRRYMESRIGFDFGKVRIHSDARAASSAKAVGALAYTVDSHVVFGTGRYAPNTSQGRRLLAHELTHVVQQSHGIARRPAGISPAPAHIQREEDDKGPGLFSDPKGWALAKLRKIPGYDLFCTIIGTDLATGAAKERSPGTLLREVLKLVHEEEAYDRVIASGALQKAYEWVSGELESLGLNLGYFKGLLTQAIDSVSFGDLKDIPGAIERIVGIFRPAFDKVLAFASAAVHKLFEIALRVAMEKLGPLGEQVMGILSKVSDTFFAIAKDPIKFVGNLVQAVKLGFTNFAHNILKHLQDSLMDFLFGELGSKITIPKAFSVGAIFNIALDLLDLHYDKFRERLVEKTSPETVAFLEGSYDFIMKIASAKSLAGAWEVFKQRAGDLIDGLVDTAIAAIKDWVVTKVVQAAIVKIVELFNPASALLEAIEAIYHTIVVLIEKGKQLLAVLQSVTNSIALIAAGNLSQSADWVERGMGSAFTFILEFFAQQAGLGGIGETIRGIITKVHDKVWAVIDKVIDFVIDKTKNLYARGKVAAGKALEWWHQRKEVLIGDEEHAIYMEGSQDDPKLMLSSTPTSWAEYVSKLKPKKGQQAILNETVKLVAELEKPFDKGKSAGEESEQVTRKRAVFAMICANIQKLGFQKEAPPKSEVEFDKNLAPGDGGTRATANVLSSLHEAGSQPSDDAGIWKNLGEEEGSVRRRKNYVQGHLLNHNIGGPGLRFNLTPINKRANARHHAIVEKDIKRMVLQEKKVVFYEVKAIYGTHPAKPKPMVKLEEAQAQAGGLDPASEKKLAEYQAEQKLARGLEYHAYELQHTAENKWEKVESTEITGGIPNELDLDK